MWWPAMGGLVIGVGGLIDSRVLGVGYETIHGLMRGEIVGPALVGLVLAKGIVWSVALGSGTSGGVLAPLLMLGGALGAMIGSITGSGDPGLWAMVGMAAMMGGTMRSPLTGMVFVLELTHDFQALPALLVGSVAALCVTVLLLRRSILTEKLARRGQHIAREYSVDVFELMRVADVMDRNPPIVPETMTVGELSEKIARGDPTLGRRQGIIIAGADGRLAGIITRSDMVDVLQRGASAETTVLEAGTADAIVTHPDETLHDAIDRMLKHNVGRLPVVERASPDRIVGYLGRADVLAARQKRQDEEEHREQGPLVAGRRSGAAAS
jgi:CBS domain-containing protein